MAMLKFDPKADVTSRNPIKADPAVNNNVLLTLVSVNVEAKMQELDTNKAPEMQSEYSGHIVPRIYFQFKQTYMPNSDLAREGKERFYTFTESPIVSFKNATNPGYEREKIDDDTIANLYGEQFKHLMHIYKAFEGTPNYRPMDKEINLDPTLPVAERCKMFAAYFQHIANGINGAEGELASFVDADGKPIMLIAKTIVNKNGKRLEFPTFTGTGFIERAKISGGKVINTFEFKPNETIVVSKTERNPIPGGLPPTITGAQGGLEDLMNMV